MPTLPSLVAARPRAVEAQSLDSLNDLAGNPPAYPERPNGQELGPLVLYISRVPGKRDVILSPFKPQARNVTQTDINNSLYYVILGDPASELSAHQTDSARSSSEGAPSQHTIPRKPLPESARSLTPESLPSANGPRAPSGLLGEHGQGATARPGSRQEASPSPSSSGPNNDSGLGLGAGSDDATRRPSFGLRTGMPARKPVASQSGTSATTQPVPMLTLDVPAPKNDVLRAQAAGSGGLTAGPVAAHPPSASSHSLTSSLAGTPFVLTLIRRNPVQNAQFNAARVSSRQLDSPPGANQIVEPTTSATTPASAPIDIEIETSGYAKFRRRLVRPSAGVDVEAALAAAASEVTAPRRDIGIFSRRVAMEYSKSYTKSLTANIKGKLGRLERAGRARIGQGRGGSAASIDSAMFSTMSGSEEESMTKPRGYTFQSPWGGKCDFRTGVSGRTVRCEHTMRSAGPAVYNPLVAEQGSGVAKRGPVTVSELRFSLPTSELLGEQSKSGKGLWRGNLDRLLRPGVEHDDDAPPREVGLGAERAGGGARGRNAKLGKLIVYSDGLKMLDLLVAANMGVWWGAWERTF